MFLRYEKIISENDGINGLSEAEQLEIVRREIAKKITDEIIKRGFLKLEISNELHDDFGVIRKIRGTVQVFNPDQ